MSIKVIKVVVLRFGHDYRVFGPTNLVFSGRSLILLHKMQSYVMLAYM